MVIGGGIGHVLGASHKGRVARTPIKTKISRQSFLGQGFIPYKGNDKKNHFSWIAVISFGKFSQFLHISADKVNLTAPWTKIVKHCGF